MAQTKKGKKTGTAKIAKAAKTTKAARAAKAAQPVKPTQASKAVKPVKTSKAAAAQAKAGARATKDAAAETKADATVERAATGNFKERLRARFGSLQKWNKWLAVIYGVEALAILLLSVGHTFPVTIKFLGVDTLLSQQAGHTIYAAASRHLFDMPLAQVLGLVLAISAVIHALQASYIRSIYEEWLERGANPLRWLDGSFSASLLPVAIGLAAGFSDLTSLLMLFVLGFMAHILGLLVELYNQPYQADKPIADTRPFTLLVVASITVWLVLGLYIGASALFGGGLPLYIWATYLTALVFVAAIGAVLLSNYRRRAPFKSYVRSERAIMLLGFAAKSIIAWELFAAVLHP